MKASRFIFLAGFVALSVQSVSFAVTVNEEKALREFVGTDAIVSSIYKMEAENKLSAELSAKPWAGYYWPDGFGGLVNPYRDRKFPHSPVRMIGDNSGFNRTLRWLKRSFRGANLKPDVYALSDEQLDVLSPAEKYDLLFSNTDFTFTHSILNDIKTRIDGLNGQRLAMWEGICNGWSLAALNVDRPKKPVQVQSFSGRMITFYPHDIMAIAAMLYARSPVNNWGWYVRDASDNRTPMPLDTVKPEQIPGASFEPVWLKFMGRRCYEHTDTTGCGDINPAILHLAIVNSIGFQDSGFIMDKHKDPTIANVTVFGYKSSPYNPRNGKNGSLAESVQVVDGVRQVGIDMTLEYVTELHPYSLSDQELEHYWDFEKSKEMKFSYILSLDGSGKIVDGKWTKRVITKYPDFLWKLPKGMQAYSGFEGTLNMLDWANGAKVPASWTATSQTASKALQPLGVVLYNLVNESRK